MTVGVVIPTYNRSRHLRRAIDSVLSQTRRPDRVIVVDDASEFDLRAYLDDYRDEVTLITHDQNRGGGAARNTGFKHLDTDYVAFLDSDDYWAPQKIARQMEVARSSNADLVYCDEWIITERGERIPSGIELLEEDVWEALLNGWTAPNTSTLVISSKAFSKVGGFDTKLASCQDHDLWMRLAERGSVFAYVPDRLTYFTREADNRISLSGLRREEGIRGFLDKWRDKIIAETNTYHFYRFRWDYMLSMWPVVLNQYQLGHWGDAIRIFGRNLALNPIFYARAFTTGLSRISNYFTGHRR